MECLNSFTKFEGAVPTWARAALGHVIWSYGPDRICAGSGNGRPKSHVCGFSSALLLVLPLACLLIFSKIRLLFLPISHASSISLSISLLQICIFSFQIERFEMTSFDPELRSWKDINLWLSFLLTSLWFCLSFLCFFLLFFSPISCAE